MNVVGLNEEGQNATEAFFNIMGLVNDDQFMEQATANPEMIGNLIYIIDDIDKTQLPQMFVNRLEEAKQRLIPIDRGIQASRHTSSVNTMRHRGIPDELTRLILSDDTGISSYLRRPPNNQDEMEGRARPLLNRVGGKYLLYKKVIATFPKDYTKMTYVEPFVGGGSIFFNKERCKKEIINDFDEIIYNFYKETQKNYKGLEKRINGTYTKKDFYELKDMKPTSISGKMAQHFILKFLSYGGFGEQWNTSEGRGGTHRVINKDLEPYHKQLENVTILNEDYKKVVEKYDSPDTFFYLDPPYENSMKMLIEYKDISMEDFANVIYNIKGKFLISINNSPTIRRLFKDYKIKKVKTFYGLSSKYVTELLISNY